MIFCILLAMTLAQPRPAVDAELAKLQGSWALASETRDGKKAAPAAIKGTILRLQGSDWSITGNTGAGTSAKGTITIDPAKKPKQVDSTQGEGPDQGKVYLGIYKLEGDTQTACFAPPGKPRPTAFASPPGSGLLLQVWKRQRR